MKEFKKAKERTLSSGYSIDEINKRTEHISNADALKGLGFLILFAAIIFLGVYFS